MTECDRSFTRSDALAKHMRTVHEPEELQAKKGQGPKIKLRLMNGSNKSNLPATAADKNPANAGLTPSDPDWDPSPPSDNIKYTPARHPITGQPGFLINYPPDISFTAFESEIPADQLLRLIKRQLHWAKLEGEEINREVEFLEAKRKEEWVKKEVLFEAVMEAELERGKVGGMVGKERFREEMERDVLSRGLKWNGSPWWKKEGNVDVDVEMERREKEINKTIGKVEPPDNADMMAVGALMGLSGAAN